MHMAARVHCQWRIIDTDHGKNNFYKIILEVRKRSLAVLTLFDAEVRQVEAGHQAQEKQPHLGDLASPTRPLEIFCCPNLGFVTLLSRDRRGQHC